MDGASLNWLAGEGAALAEGSRSPQVDVGWPGLMTVT